MEGHDRQRYKACHRMMMMMIAHLIAPAQILHRNLRYCIAHLIAPAPILHRNLETLHDTSCIRSCHLARNCMFYISMDIIFFFSGCQSSIVCTIKIRTTCSLSCVIVRIDYPHNRSLYHYFGSLSTCTERVFCLHLYPMSSSFRACSYSKSWKEMA